MKTLCIIPARGGSKRIPRKNIRPVLGRPLMGWTIALAQASGLFDEVMVSTDDPEIAGVARQSGASVPFLRSGKTAGDHATTAAVMHEVLASYESAGHHGIDRVCCIYPTAVLLLPEQLAEAHRLLEMDLSLDTVMSVQRYRHPIERAFRLEDGLVRALSEEKQAMRTQDLTPAFYDAGQFYWFRAESFRRREWIVGPRCAAVFIGPLDAVDLDDESDWQVLQQLMQTRHAT